MCPALLHWNWAFWHAGLTGPFRLLVTCQLTDSQVLSQHMQRSPSRGATTEEATDVKAGEQAQGDGAGVHLSVAQPLPNRMMVAVTVFQTAIGWLPFVAVVPRSGMSC